MKLLVNISPLNPPISGIGHYTSEILKRLIIHPEVQDINAFSLGKFKSKKGLHKLLINNSEQLKKLADQKNDLPERIKYQIKNTIKRIPLARTLKTHFQNRLISKYSNQYLDYIYWEPNYVLSNFDGLSIPTVYDLSHIRYPQFQLFARLKWLEKNLPKSLEKAAKIMTISKFSKQEIIDIYGIAADKISIVPPAVSAGYRIKYSQSEIEIIKSKYNLPQNYILSVGNIEPRKNIVGLLSAFDQLSTQHKKQYPLVLIGAKGWLTTEIERKIQQIQKKAKIIRLGYVPQAELPIIYQAAGLFIYVSLYEGFGMPIAEAMASNIPIITSNCSSMPAVANGCAKLVDPYNIKEISDTIALLIEDKNLQKSLTEKGLLISKAYTWENSAKKLIDVFKEVDINKKSKV